MSKSWAASGRRPERGAARAPRPPDSWSMAVARAREWWVTLAGPPDRVTGLFSDVASAAILSTALGLWADTAAALATERGED